MQKRASNHFLHFTKKERNGILALVTIIAMLVAAPFIYPAITTKKIVPENKIGEQLAALQSIKKDSIYSNYHPGIDEEQLGTRKTFKKYNPNEGELFAFDPNDLSPDGWKRLGVRDKTIQTIRKFVDKGGRFREADDIKKIWGLHDDQIKRLLPFVKIKAVEKLEKQYPGNKPAYEKKKPLLVDINLADTTAFIALPWIGSKLAKRIVDFREKLGGFISVEQVGETFGLQDSVFQKIRPQLVVGGEAIRRININSASLDEFKQHPYIRYQFGNAIVQYRNQHGNFAVPEDLRKIMIITEEWYNKVYPYLSVK